MSEVRTGRRTNYARGRGREYRVMRALEAAGETCVRSAGSHGAWDICSVGPGRVRLIQVKSAGESLADAKRKLEALPIARSYAACYRVYLEIWQARPGHGWFQHRWSPSDGWSLCDGEA